MVRARRLLLLVIALAALVGAPARADDAPAVPDGSGDGRRVVYSNAQQRVWLVEEDGTVARTYLVSGRHHYPRSGSYAVFSRSENSRAGSLSLPYMVRFACSARTSVGFHAIPMTRSGRLIQPLSALGTPRSHGCVRQSIDDARFLWDWAPLGTPVIVVA